MLTPWIESLKSLSLLEATGVLLALNVLQFMLSLGLAHGLIRLGGGPRLAPEGASRSAPGAGLLSLVVALNTATAVVGWLLWNQGWITVLTGEGPLRILRDVLVLMMAMDLVMYGLHRLAHHPWLYGWLHARHHEAVDTRPIDLFFLSPLEVVAYGALWVFLLMAYDSTIEGILLYLSINLASGTIGHLGTSLTSVGAARGPLRFVGTARFHAGHHITRAHNFGFYTSIWDHLAGTYRLQVAPDETNEKGS